jgi:hypothetical protein
MTAPNLLNASNVTAKSTGLVLTTGAASNVVINSTGSNTLVKLNYWNIANNGSTNINSNVYLTKSSGTVYPLIANVSVPAGTALVAWGKDAPVYLEEGDYVSSNASATTNLVATTSYEIIS